MSTRTALIAELRQRLEREDSPRMTMLVLLVLAGGVAFLTSLFALDAGLSSMAVRYALAVIAGYVAFLLLIRGWIALRRRARWRDIDPEIDPNVVLEFLDPRLPFNLTELARDSARPTEAIACGGRSDAAGGGAAGGGGAGGGTGGGTSWTTSVTSDAVERTRAESAAVAQSAARSAADGVGASLDLDELVWLLVAAAALCLGLVCLSYVVYTAPLLLAEVALDAALVSAVYRRLRRDEAGHWTGAVLRRTWLPTAGLAVFMAIVGYALQQVAPEARSIGGVIQALLS